MPLTVHNNIPLINIYFGCIQNYSDISFALNIDSCSAMNVRNLKIHQWVITTHPEIFSSFIQYKKENLFDPITLNCEVEDYKKIKVTCGKLTDIIVHNKNYFHQNSTKIIKIEFGLGKEVAVNAIFDIPTLKERKASIIFGSNFLSSALLQTQFPLIYKPTNTGLPSSAAFKYKYFIQTRKVTSSGQTLVMNMITDTPDININSRVKPLFIFTIQE